MRRSRPHSAAYKRRGRGSLLEASRVLFQGLHEFGPTRAMFKVSHAGQSLRAKGRTGCNSPERPENEEDCWGQRHRGVARMQFCAHNWQQTCSNWELGVLAAVTMKDTSSEICKLYFDTDLAVERHVAIFREIQVYVLAWRSIEYTWRQRQHFPSKCW
jgi:hypothetical protein